MADLDLIPVDVLVVDDTPANLQAMRAILGDEPGYRITEAASGPEALRAVLKKDFCVILLDAVLPGMDGFETAELIKQREKSRDVPILFLTASGTDVHTLARAYQAGAVDYLVKPIEPEIVRAKVAVFAELHRKTLLIEQQAARLQESERREQAARVADLLTASERRYRNLAEAIPQIVWRALPDGTIEYRNHRWFAYTGAGTADDTWDFLHPDDREACLSQWREALRAEAPFQCEARLLSAAGSYRWHLRRALPERGRDGEVVAWLGTDTDIDDRKRADDERVELLVRERAARFEAEAAQKRAAELYIEASEAVRLRDEFLTVAAHELRTPLTSLKLQSQSLVRRSPDDTSRVMLRQVDRLCRLVDQLLDVSRISAGKLLLQLERSDLQTLAVDVAGRLADEAAASGCNLVVHGAAPMPLECDPMRIEQVITNLVSNAIKYGRGKPVELELSQVDGRLRLAVRDHGIGVQAGDQTRIFERFERAVSVREYGGLGLGLYISRQIVQAHGGTIAVSSDPGAGSTFAIELPLDRASAPAPATAAAAASVH